MLKKTHDRITDLFFGLSGITLAAITTSYLYQVFMRYFFNSPSSWANDLVSYFLLLMVFFALPKITQEHKHVTVTFLTEKLTGNSARSAYRITNLLSCAACLATGVYSLNENLFQISNNIYTMGNHPIPKWWLSLSISYGFISSALYFLRAAIDPELKQEANTDPYSGAS